MSKFKRGSKAKKKAASTDDAWIIGPEGQPLPGDPDYDFMRPDKRAVPEPTETENRVARFQIAKAMIRSFGYKQWMSGENVIGPNGERINTTGEVI